MTTSVVRPSARALVSDDLFRRLTDRLIEDEGYGSHLAERIMEQALAFLDACAINKGTPLSPSKLVDVGWHTFLMYTKDYAEFCHRIAGRFIHHVPDDAPGRSSAASDVRSRTMAAIERAGHAIDHELWEPVDGKCGQCHEEGNCRASGADGNENADTRPT